MTLRTSLHHSQCMGVAHQPAGSTLQLCIWQSIYICQLIFNTTAKYATCSRIVPYVTADCSFPGSCAWLAACYLQASAAPAAKYRVPAMPLQCVTNTQLHCQANLCAFMHAHPNNADSGRSVKHRSRHYQQLWHAVLLTHPTLSMLHVATVAELAVLGKKLQILWLRNKHYKRSLLPGSTHNNKLTQQTPYTTHRCGTGPSTHTCQHSKHPLTACSYSLVKGSDAMPQINC